MENITLTKQEEMFISHVKRSVELTLNNISKLNDYPQFVKNKRCKTIDLVQPIHHILNNLCSLEKINHLHIGLYTGGSFIASMLGNTTVRGIGIDNFAHDQDIHHEQITNEQCDLFLPTDVYNREIIVKDAFSISDDDLRMDNIDVYFYDADHSYEAQEEAFTYYNPLFKSSFIAIVDDWGIPDVEKGTLSAFYKLNYKVLYKDIIPAGPLNGTGQYVAVIRK